jgi:hypothetical protein
MRFLFCGGCCRKDRQTTLPKKTKKGERKEQIHPNSLLLFLRILSFLSAIDSGARDYERPDI